jgi:hypothetical protein
MYNNCNRKTKLTGELGDSSISKPKVWKLEMIKSEQQTENRLRKCISYSSGGWEVHYQGVTSLWGPSFSIIPLLRHHIAKKPITE